jgi:hypothetical protein
MPSKALNFDPLRALMTTFPPVIALCVLGLRYIAYNSPATAGRVTDCLTSLGMKFSSRLYFK